MVPTDSKRAGMQGAKLNLKFISPPPKSETFFSLQNANATKKIKAWLIIAERHSAMPMPNPLVRAFKKGEIKEVIISKPTIATKNANTELIALNLFGLLSLRVDKLFSSARSNCFIFNMPLRSKLFSLQAYHKWGKPHLHNLLQS